MCSLSNTFGSITDGETSGEDGDIAKAFTRNDFYQELIDKANTVPIVRIFKFYGIKLDEYNRKTICPFKFHKGGRESTPSFYYYSNTNSFICFGCNSGGRNCHGCEFISTMDEINKVKAAYKILDLFADDVDPDICKINNKESFSERLEIMMNFSNIVREFRQTYLDEKSQKFIEIICEVYDQHNFKRSLDNETLRNIVEQMKEKINLYSP